MSNVPAVREMPSQDAPVVAALDRLSNEQIRYIASTEVVPKHLRGKPEAMLAVILKGRALGFDDVHALSTINFIDGRATMSAESMVALVRSKGHSIRWELEPGEKCIATGKRKDTEDEGSVTWTMAMARDAGLASKDNWKRHPDTMLTWRAVSQLCRFLFGDVLLGVSYTEDEAHEAAERGRVTAAVSDLPAVEESKVRTEPLSGPSEAQLNRIAILEQRSGEGYRMLLRGVFGREMASELSEDEAVQYEAHLEMALPNEEPTPDSAEEPSGTDSAEMSLPADGTAEAVDEPGQGASEGESSSADDPEPEPAPAEEVEGEVVEEEGQGDLVELAAATEIPIGNYRGTPIGAIHDDWLEWGLRNTGKLPGPFVEALELYVRERKPELWARERES